MNRIAVVTAAALLLAASLDAQRNPRGSIPRVPRTGTGLPRPGYLDPGSIERRPLIPAHTGPIPLPSPARQWVRAETAHFILFGATGENAVRAVAHDLEKLTALLTRTSPYFRLPPERTRIFLFAERRNVQPYFDAVANARVDASGLTLRHPKGSTTLVDTSARGGGGLTPRHELVHDLIRRGNRLPPLWVDEGLAEYFSNGGLPVREHASRLRGRLRMPLPEMFATHAEDPRAWSFDFYAQSWAVVATLLRRDRAAFWQMLQDVDGGRDAAEAIEARYGLSLRELEFAMRKVSAPATSLLVESAPPIELTVTPLPYPDLLVELGELLARVKGREADAEHHFLAALEQDGNNAAAHLAYAELLLSIPERVVDAHVHRPYLERAYERAPDRVEVAFPLFTLYVNTGERALADNIFPRLADSPRGYDARRLLLDVDIPRADALAREGHLHEAAQILRDLAPKMPDKTRANLEGQAARLESLAAPP